MNIKIFTTISKILQKINIKLISKFGTHSHLLSSFTQAVFNDQIHSIKWDSFNCQQMRKFSFCLNLRPQKAQNTEIDWIQSADLQQLSTSIQVIWKMSHKHQRYLVDKNVYLRILLQYYKRIQGMNENVHLNNKIRSNINIKYFLPNFMYTHDRQVLSLLKQKQPILLNTLFKSRITHIGQFIKIFPLSVYNITDWPYIQNYFYQNLYTNFDQIKTMAQFQKIFEYVNRFNRISHFLVNKFFTFANKFLQNEKAISVDNFLSLCNCMGFILFEAKNNNQLVEFHKDNQLLRLSASLLQKEVQIQQVKLSVSSILMLRSTNKLIDYLFYKVQKEAKAFINKQSEVDQNVPEIFKVAQARQKELLSKIQIMIESVRINLMPKIIRGILVNAYLYRISLADFKSLLECQHFTSFIMKYPFYPRILKQTTQTIASLNMINKEKIQIPLELAKAQKEINTFLNVTLKSKGEKEIIEQYFSKKQIFQHYLPLEPIWNMKGESLLIKLMLLNDYSANNILGMLKDDRNFVYSRAEPQIKQEIKKLIKQERRIDKKQFDVWEYPQYFITDISAGGKNMKLMSHDGLIQNYTAQGLKYSQTVGLLKSLKNITKRWSK